MMKQVVITPFHNISGCGTAAKVAVSTTLIDSCCDIERREDNVTIYACMHYFGYSVTGIMFSVGDIARYYS